VNDSITHPPQGISDVSEWCKKDGCWARLADQADTIAALMPDDFWAELTSAEEADSRPRLHARLRKLTTGSKLSVR
jgi:hypothetical protein